MRVVYTILLLLSSSIVFGQSLAGEIDNIYNFKPAKLSKKEQESKMPALDGFWEKVKKDTATCLPLLRTELQHNKHNPFFYYDGSGLLLSLTNNEADKDLAVNAMAKCDLEDIDRKIYVQTLNHLSNDGIEVTRAAVKILANDKFAFFIPQHALKFTQEYSLMYMLLPQSNTSYVDTLMALFKTQNSTAQKSIIATLWFAYTCKGEAFLKDLETDQTLSKEVREYVKQTMDNTKLSKEEMELIKSPGDSNVTTMRNNALKRFSDEALDELLVATIQMRKENKCR